MVWRGNYLLEVYFLLISYNDGLTDFARGLVLGLLEMVE